MGTCKNLRGEFPSSPLFPPFPSLKSPHSAYTFPSHSPTNLPFSPHIQFINLSTGTLYPGKLQLCCTVPVAKAIPVTQYTTSNDLQRAFIAPPPFSFPIVLFTWQLSHPQPFILPSVLPTHPFIYLSIFSSNLGAVGDRVTDTSPPPAWSSIEGEEEVGRGPSWGSCPGPAP